MRKQCLVRLPNGWSLWRFGDKVQWRKGICDDAR